MRVRLVYRNYRPIHEIYRNTIENPPLDVTYIVAKPVLGLKRFYKIYSKYGQFYLIKKCVEFAQRYIFERSPNSLRNKSVDIIHYAQMLPTQVPKIPFVVDFSHASALANFQEVNAEVRERISNILSSKECRAIIAMSEAAKKSLLKLLNPNDAVILAPKISVIYPALPRYCIEELGKQTEDNLKLLFVGTHVYRKGLHELILAFKQLKMKGYSLSLSVVSDAEEGFIEEYSHPDVQYYPTGYSKEELISEFFLKHDVLVLPTHGDLFGMVLLDAMSAGMVAVTTDQFAGREIVEHMKNGLLLESKKCFLDEVDFPNKRNDNEYFRNQEIPEEHIIKSIYDKIAYLIENPNQLIFMKRINLKSFDNKGKFSLKTRQDALKRIYDNILSN